MEDARTGRRVPCTASIDAVRDKIVKVGQMLTGNTIADFDSVGDLIEEEASRQYDTSGKMNSTPSRSNIAATASFDTRRQLVLEVNYRSNPA